MRALKQPVIRVPAATHSQFNTMSLPMSDKSISRVQSQTYINTCPNSTHTDTLSNHQQYDAFSVAMATFNRHFYNMTDVRFVAETRAAVFEHAGPRQLKTQLRAWFTKTGCEAKTPTEGGSFEALKALRWYIDEQRID